MSKMMNASRIFAAVVIALVALTACATTREGSTGAAGTPSIPTAAATPPKITPELQKAIGVYQGGPDRIVIEQRGDDIVVEYWGYGKKKMDSVNTLSVNGGRVHLQVAGLLLRDSGVSVTLELDLYGDVFVGRVYTKGSIWNARFYRER